MYHVALDLSPERVKKLKVLAAANGTTVRSLATKMVVEGIEKEEQTKR